VNIEQARQDRDMLERLVAHHRREIRRLEALIIKQVPTVGEASGDNDEEAVDDAGA
jgi:hypothetical protein